MSHRKDLLKKGYIHGMISSNKEELKKLAFTWKSRNKIKFYRIVPFKDSFELYVKR